jgi:hypothetical protein
MRYRYSEQYTVVVSRNVIRGDISHGVDPTTEIQYSSTNTTKTLQKHLNLFHIPCVNHIVLHVVV